MGFLLNKWEYDEFYVGFKVLVSLLCDAEKLVVLLLKFNIQLIHMLLDYCYVENLVMEIRIRIRPIFVYCAWNWY